ncbi:MAG: hypothetical protein DRQ02_09905 [Candidatus Latescibacterota bacterium]|nr:MAG: hypothetical protein DRQ02_09905 [Candidatus Latescibacterota bacterium]
MDKRYKQSRYNFFFDAEDGTHLAFNAMSGGLAIIEDGNRDEVQRILADPNSYRSDTEEKKRLWDSLLKGGFLIEKERDELAVLKMRNRVGRFNTDSFGLIIMPTLQCNFRCVYCYESFPNISMKPEIEEGIVRWVRERTRFVKTFHVSWFGGEPLLRFDVIKRLGSEFKKIAEDRGCQYGMSITTNGYLLDEEKIKQLVPLDLQRVQVTLDGPPEVHDRRRPLANGRGTFNQILENLVALDRLAPQVHITLRVNFDKTNLMYVPQLLHILPQGLRDRAGIYFRHVFSYHRNWSDMKCEKLANPSQNIAELQKKSIMSDFRHDPADSIGPMAAYCYADYWNRFVVGPEGNLYKCTVAIEPGDRVGYITPHGKAHTTPLLEKWASVDPFEDEECRNCKWLPVCMGGCSRPRVYGEAKVCFIEQGAAKEQLNNIYWQFKKEAQKLAALSVAL